MHYVAWVGAGKKNKRQPVHVHTCSSQDQSLVAEIDSLRKSQLDLEQRLHELSEEKRRVENEMGRQQEAFHKVQEREQDLSKDIETLRDENSHHTGTISKLQVQCTCTVTYA